MKRSLIASAILMACSSAPVLAQDAAADAGADVDAEAEAADLPS